MFSIFLVCSFLAWLVSKLSEPYDSQITLNLNYTNLPDTILAAHGYENRLKAKVNASGFQFLFYNFSLKEINLDLSKTKVGKSRFYLPRTELRKIIEPQLADNMKLLDIDIDSLFLDVFQVISKEVEVVPNMNLNLKQNHLMDGPLIVKPNSVTLKGPKEEIQSIKKIKTKEVELLDVTEDFSVSTQLHLPENMANAIISSNSVQLSGKVVRFSEKVFEMDVVVLGSPEGFDIKTFPKSVSVLCKASIENLKSIGPNDFQVTTDYRDRVGDKLFLNISVFPKNALDVRLSEKQVNFILEEQ